MAIENLDESLGSPLFHKKVAPKSRPGLQPASREGMPRTLGTLGPAPGPAPALNPTSRSRAALSTALRKRPLLCTPPSCRVL